MRRRPTLLLSLAALLALAGCGAEEPGSAAAEDDTAGPAPVGADVGAAGADGTAVPVVGDSAAAAGAHP